MEKRGREYERAFDRAYLETVYEGYVRAFRDPGDTPLLVVDTSEADLSADEALRVRLWAAIDEHREGVRHWKP